MEQPGHHGCCALGEGSLRASSDPELVTLLPLPADVSEIAQGLGGFKTKVWYLSILITLQQHSLCQLPS